MYVNVNEKMVQLAPAYREQLLATIRLMDDKSKFPGIINVVPAMLEMTDH